MGLLDDAIREHLELKRRHGADPAELDQQARDALGPSRRDEAEPRAAAPAPAPTPAPARDLDPSWDDEDDHDLLPEPEPELPARPRSTGSIRTDRPADAPLADPERTRAFSVEEEREALAPRPAATPEPPARERRRAEPVDESDELEQTPEFLEDTPEHDRLWFEQRPPKDFDF